MSIDRIGSEFLRSLVPGRFREDGDRVEGEGSRESKSPPRGDRVDLSPEGRALAAQLRGDSLSASRGAELVGRIESGVYDDPAVAEEVARRIHDSGDLHADA